MKKENGDLPRPPKITDEKDLRTYEWPELSETLPAKGLKVEITPGLMFPTPRAPIVATYEVPQGVIAWGWSAERNDWSNLMELGGFHPRYEYVTFMLPERITTSATAIIFLEIFPTPAEVLDAFPDNTREYPPEESILDELNLALEITIRDCTEKRSIPLYEDGNAFVEITVPHSVPFEQVQERLEPGRQAARDLAEARARRKLVRTAALTVTNATCPDDCILALGTPREVSVTLTHDRLESVRGDGQNMYVDWYSRQVAHCYLELKCRSM